MNDVFEAILPILLFLIVVLGLTTLAVCFYDRVVKLSDIKARRIEIIGYALLFTVLVWELIVKNFLLGDFYNDDWVFLNDKLRAIYHLLEDILTYGNDEAYKYGDVFNKDTTNYVAIQLLTADIIEAILKISSTVFIAIGRFHELEKLRVHKNSKSIDHSIDYEK